MSRPGQKPLEGLIAAIAGLAAVYPDKTVNATAELMNCCLAELVKELAGEEKADALFEVAIKVISPTLEEEFGIKVVSIRSPEKQAVTETDDLLTKLRKGGL